MSGFEIGIISIIAMLLLIYIGMHVPVVLALISFVGVWLIKGNVKIGHQPVVADIRQNRRGLPVRRHTAVCAHGTIGERGRDGARYL